MLLSQLDKLPEQGAHTQGEQIVFRLWAPYQEHLNLLVISGQAEHRYPMRKNQEGYFEYPLDTHTIDEPLHYYYETADGTRLPDPASRFQPNDVQGPSAFVSKDFPWEDHGWKGIALENYIIYELHVGTFTEQGTFESILEHVERLKAMGITCVELMPVAQCSGRWNWGYDGVFPFATQHTYGGPRNLKKIVNAFHKHGIAVALDVVYNHLGPEGCHLSTFAPYFSSRHQTPWGQGINYDGESSEHVRAFFLKNILQWVDEFHIDALRLDAIHNIKDHSQKHFLRDAAEMVADYAQKTKREIVLIGEANVHDPRYIDTEPQGFALNTLWCDDMVYAVQTDLTDKDTYHGRTYHKRTDWMNILKQGYVFEGLPWECARVEKHTHAHPAHRHVAYLNTHDVCGNHPLGLRYLGGLPLAEQKRLLATLLLAPALPMLFMGDEWGATSPFYFFVDHKDKDLLNIIEQGRADEFPDYDWTDRVRPSATEAFTHSKLVRPQASLAQELENWCTQLINIRKDWIDQKLLDAQAIDANYAQDGQSMSLRYTHPKVEAFMIASKEPSPEGTTQATLQLSHTAKADNDWNIYIGTQPTPSKR